MLMFLEPEHSLNGTLFIEMDYNSRPDGVYIIYFHIWLASIISAVRSSVPQSDA